MTQFDSSQADEAAVIANNSTNGPAVWAESAGGRSVVAIGHGDSCGLWGEVDAGRAIVGAVHGEGSGVWGDVNTGRSIVGVVRAGGGAGVWGETTNGAGVVGKDNSGGDGVVGEGRRGVVGKSPEYQGVYGWSRDNAGVVGESDRMHGLFGISHAPGFAGVFGTSTGPDGLAAAFEGSVEIRKRGRLVLQGGDVILANADCAEDFDVIDPEVEPGTVMVLTDQGGLRASDAPYDRRVAGIVSGAGHYRPGIVLDRPCGRTPGRLPIALVGKVFCKVDATAAPVAVGDLLTTSGRPGHAMVAGDPVQAFGAVIGKSLGTLPGGTGLLPVLVALQ